MSAMRTLAFAAVAAVLAACSKPAPSIVGRWKSEGLRIDSLVVPLGPELLISERELFMPGMETRVPLAAIELGTNEATLKTWVGVGWTFYFESADRIYADVPFAGRLYYRRAVDVPQPVPAPVPPSAAQTEPIAAARARMFAGDVTGAQVLLDRAEASAGRTPELLLERAALANLRSERDEALRLLDAALRRGLGPLRRIEDDARLASLRSDVRYGALLARYR